MPELQTKYTRRKMDLKALDFNIKEELPRRASFFCPDRILYSEYEKLENIVF